VCGVYQNTMGLYVALVSCMWHDVEEVGSSRGSFVSDIFSSTV
jgi:hypothetical protein